MLGYMILLFTLVPVIELALLIKVGQILGVFNTIMIVIFTGVTGACLAKYQGLVALQKIQADMNQGKMPGDKLFDGFIILASGILLLTPGLITDCIGFMGLIPSTRTIFKRFLKRKMKDMIDRGTSGNFTIGVKK
ncbi:MAG: FxsA family protein [Candidatus Ancaeobacter aquaticus]|nr:FxsA family protein [Candidatus Ancaeobacter aquaticus]